MTARAARTLTVIHKKYLTPNMIRIVLSGNDLASFPKGQESGYVKLCFPTASKTTVLTRLLNKPKTLKRSYTIRAFDADELELTLDFVAHGDNGPASAWALSTKVGDVITVDGPGPVKLVDMSAPWFVIAGDMTALPAISVNLEKLPPHAKGYAVIEVLSEADQQSLIAPEGIEIHWVINPDPTTANTVLSDKVKSLPWLEGEPNVWLASEFDSMRQLRRYFKQERNVSRGQVYASSYWKMGETDEGNKQAKKQDTDA